MKSEIKEQYVNSLQIAAICGLTQRRVEQLSNENKLPDRVKHKFPMVKTLTALFAYLQRDGEDIAKEKLKKLTAERHMLELKLASQRGEMMATADAEQAAAEAMQFIFSELERGERELPPALAGMDAVGVYQRLHSFTETMRKNAKRKFEDVSKPV